jgi:hypothetical protein
LAHRYENNEEINMFLRAECSLRRAGGFSWNWEVPLSQENFKTGSIQKNFIGTVYVYHCEIFLIILTQKILNLVSGQDAFYKPGSTLSV